MIIQKILINASQKLKKAGIKSAYLDSEILMSFVLKKPKEWIYANSEKEISISNYKKFQRLILRRLKFEPIAYLIGEKEFYGLKFKVNKNVLIPRPETEILVEVVLKELTKRDPFLQWHKGVRDDILKIADIGTGSGNIAITLAKKMKIKNCRLKFFASDISDKALKIAKINARNHQVSSKIQFLKGDLLEAFRAIRNLKFDIIIANLPYLDKKTLNQNPELKFEPQKALAGAKKGLEIYTKFFQDAPKYLKRNSKIFIEIGDNEFQTLREIVRKKLPKRNLKTIKDFQNINRVLIIY